MIARCDHCDAKAARTGAPSHFGYRYTGPLVEFHCGWCAGPLRPKKKGETESAIVPARPGPAKRLVAR